MTTTPITWTSWNLRIGDKAFKDVRPLAMEINREVADISTGYLWWRKEKLEYSGRWYVKLTYDRGPLSNQKSDFIYFADEPTARSWYDEIFNACFLGRISTQAPKSPPPPPTKKPKSPNKDNPLRLV